MTEPHRDPVGRARKLESIVDDLDDKVANEREAEGVPGNPADRDRHAVSDGVENSEDEPPD